MGLKTAGVGHFTIPTAPAAGTSVTSGSANVFTTTYVALSASAPSTLFITGIHCEEAAASAATYIIVQLATGTAGSESIVGQYLVPLSTGSTVALGYRQIYPPIPITSGTRIAAKTADSVGAKATLITLECIAQANVVDDGVVVGTVTNLTNAPTAGDLTATMKTSVTTAATAATPTAAAVTGAVGSVTGAVGSVTASVTLAASQHVIVDSGTVTTLTNLPAITAGWLTATGIAAAALNGKGDWNIGKTGYSLTQAFPTNFSAMALTAGGAVTAGTVSDKTGYALTTAYDPAKTAAQSTDYTSARALKLDNLDAAISTRSSYAGADTSGTTSLLSRLTALRAGNLDNLDVASSTLMASASYVAPDNASVTAIKGKTDSLTFTVAGKIDANLLHVNGLAITGSGTALSPWGPA